MAHAATARKKQPKAQDALALLRADHEEVSDLFDKYEEGKETLNEKQKGDIAATICSALTVHATIEEEIFYPACEDEVEGAEGLLAEALVEHEGVKELVAKIEAGEPGGDEYDAQVKVLGEYVKHHVKEEQDELFPKVRKSNMDLGELGSQMLARKEELEGEAT
jgi:hemerythrin-like domain-containing protein